MLSKSGSFKHNVWQLIFIPAFSIILLLSVCLVSYSLHELSKFVDMRGSAMTRKTAQLIYAPLMQQDRALVQALLDGSLEDPYIRALHVHLKTTGDSFHTGPEFLPIINTEIEPNIFTPARRETRRTIIFTHPIANKAGLNPIGWIEVEMLSSPYMVIHYQTILMTIAISLFCLLVAAYLAVCLYRAITTPLAHIKEVINHLAEGKLKTRVNTQKSFEFIDIAGAINNMAESMETAQQDLQNHIEQSTQDLRETLETIEIKNIELDIARKEAIEASRIKSEFLANTSHEIRTPLNGILGFAALTLKTNINEQQADYLNTIHNSAQSLLTVINGILDFSKLETGKLTLEYAPLPLRQTIDETLHILAPNAHEKNLQLMGYIDPKIPNTLLGDSLRFKQILSNLVSNAIKFSEQGNIIVRATTIATYETYLILKITISDQGKGLTHAQQNDLFKPFSQTDSSNSREQGGTGLGLAICKGLVERMNGEIGVKSQLDKGSTFWFTARFGIDKKSIDNIPPIHLKNHRVLLCGSNKDSLEHLQSLLYEWQISQQTISEIHDIFPTIRHVKSHNPFELLILDMAVTERKIQPSLLNKISEQLANEFNCKVIICCTAAQLQLFRTEGNNDNIIFIRKPIAYDGLLKSISENLNSLHIPIAAENNSATNDASPNISILLVDDNPANLQLASELLSGLKTVVVQASNGLQAIEAHKNNQFDVIFMDIQMPGMDGFETTKRIREAEGGVHRTPIIALTAHSITEQKSQLLIAGMDDCISKPVNEAQLAHIINRWAILGGKKEITTPENIAMIQEKLSLKKSTIDVELNLDKPSPVDIALCLKLANNKPSLAHDMLQMMLTGLLTEKTEINQAMITNNLSALGELVHRLYGSSCYCGVPQLKSASGLLDKLLQANNIIEVEAAIATLNHAIDDVLHWGKNRDLKDVFGI
jgi:two-component system, NarL family, sensor histidine kinase BarA